MMFRALVNGLKGLKGESAEAHDRHQITKDHSLELLSVRHAQEELNSSLCRQDCKTEMVMAVR